MLTTGSTNSILAGLAQGSVVAVVRLRCMGDTVLTTPALHLLKSARPDLKIFVVLERGWTCLLESNPDVDGVIALPDITSLIALESSQWWYSVSPVRSTRPALCLNLHGGAASARLTAASGARWRAGFSHYPLQRVYNIRIPRAQEILGRATDAPVHTAEHLAAAMFYLGVAPCEIPKARLYVQPARRSQPYAVLHVGAATASKQWPSERFAEVARWLCDEGALEPILVAGPDQQHLLPAGNEFATFHDLSVDSLMALLAGAELFIGNDSGPAHVAAAFGVPSVVIFGASNARMWHPWRTDHRVLESPGGIAAVEVRSVCGAVLDLTRKAASSRHFVSHG